MQQSRIAPSDDQARVEKLSFGSGSIAGISSTQQEVKPDCDQYTIEKSFE